MSPRIRLLLESVAASAALVLVIAGVAKMGLNDDIAMLAGMLGLPAVLSTVIATWWVSRRWPVRSATSMALRITGWILLLFPALVLALFAGTAVFEWLGGRHSGDDLAFAATMSLLLAFGAALASIVWAFPAYLIGRVVCGGYIRRMREAGK